MRIIQWLDSYADRGLRPVRIGFLKILFASLRQINRISGKQRLIVPLHSPLLRAWRVQLHYTKTEDAAKAYDEGRKTLETDQQNLPAISFLNSVSLSSDSKAIRKDAANKCIYCGALKFKPGSAKPLGEEHVISEAFGAQYIIPKASCEKCQRATNYFENKLLQDVYQAVNRRLGVLGKKREFLKSAYRVKRVEDGQDVTINLDLPFHPTMLCFPRFFIPGVLCGRSITRSGFAGLWQIGMNSHDPMIELGYNRFNSPELDTVIFCQFLAKVAHGFTVGELGLENFSPLLTKFIRRHTKHDTWLSRFQYVGGDPRDFRASASRHEIGWGVENRRGKNYVVVLLRLFADLGAPVFYIVTGTLNQVQLERLHGRLGVPERTPGKTPA